MVCVFGEVWHTWYSEQETDELQKKSDAWIV